MDIYTEPQDIPFGVAVLVRHQQFATPMVIVREEASPNMVDVSDAGTNPDLFNNGYWQLEDIITWCHLPL